MDRGIGRRIGVAALVAASLGLSGCASLLGGVWSGFGTGAARDDVTWEELMRSSDRFRERGDIERALVGYLRALQREPDRPLARVRLAQLQLLSDPAQAAEGFRRVLAVAPHEARAWTGLGVASLGLGRLEDAREAFSRAGEEAPDSALARAGEAVALDLLGRPEEARAVLGGALERRPEEAWLINNMAVSRLVARDWAGAEAALRTALALDPEDVAAHNNLGLALGGQERYAEAYAAFLGAGGEQAARNNVGYVLFLNGHYDEAVLEYERALAADGDATQVVLANLHTALDARDAVSDGGRHESR